MLRPICPRFAWHRALALGLSLMLGCEAFCLLHAAEDQPASAAAVGSPATVPTAAPLPSLLPHAVVDVPVLKSSFFLGLVSLTPDRFTRNATGFAATYRARVLGFFYREHGTVQIDLTPEALAAFLAGQRAAFTGHALANDGGTRRITGYAEPADAATGRLQLRIAVTKSIELSVAGPYRLYPDGPPPPPASPAEGSPAPTR